MANFFNSHRLSKQNLMRNIEHISHEISGEKLNKTWWISIEARNNNNKVFRIIGWNSLTFSFRCNNKITRPIKTQMPKRLTPVNNTSLLGVTNNFAVQLKQAIRKRFLTFGISLFSCLEEGFFSAPYNSIFLSSQDSIKQPSCLSNLR